MSPFIQNIILKIERLEMTIHEWVAGFIGVIFLRIFFEIFSTPAPTGMIVPPHQWIHYALFFLATLLILVLVVTFFTRQKNNSVLKLALYGFPIIFLAPSIDLILNITGSTYRMDYLFDTGYKLLRDFFTFFGPLTTYGITLGIRIEIFFILCSVAWYVWAKNRRVTTALFSTATSYFVIFIMLSFPGVLYEAHSFFSQTATVAFSVFTENAFIESNISQNMSSIGVGFSAIMSQIFFIISFIVGFLLFLYTNKNATLVILKNARAIRVLFYFSLLFVGASYAHEKFSLEFTWVDWVTATVLALSWFSAWMFAVHTNDLADTTIDQISDPGRPLPAKNISHQLMRETGFLWLILSLLGAYLVGGFIFLLVVVFTSAYYIYSAPPLRLKRIPLFSSFLIAVACLATVLAGFFFISPNKTVSVFPIAYSLGIIVIFTLGVNIRDIKDVKGDRKEGIQTLPVIFPLYGKQVVGALLALSFLLTPFFFFPYANYLTAVPASILGYFLCTKKPYDERLIFLLFGLYLSSILFSIVSL